MPEAELYLLIGGDSFADLHHWVRFREIPEAARLVVLARPGWDFETAPLHPEIAALAGAGRALLLRQPPVGGSSTHLRELLADGLPITPGEGLVGVVRYLHNVRR